MEGYCRLYGIPFHCIEAMESQFVNSGQDDYRNWRRQCYDEYVAKFSDKNTFVATAHTLNDQTETILMKLLRGAHMSNLRGVSLA